MAKFVLAISQMTFWVRWGNKTDLKPTTNIYTKTIRLKKCNSSSELCSTSSEVIVNYCKINILEVVVRTIYDNSQMLIYKY